MAWLGGSARLGAAGTPLTFVSGYWLLRTWYFLLMRIIAGVAKGRRLVGPAGLETRPLTDRAKEALFSSLGPAVGDAAVLDLFAGSGSLGLEALSRGAAGAVFVERDRKALAALEANMAAVDLGGTVERGDVLAYLRRGGDVFDLVFLDPPYALDDDVVADLLRLVAERMAPGGLAVLHRRYGGDPPEAPSGLHLRDRRRYGDAELWRYVKEDA